MKHIDELMNKIKPIVEEFLKEEVVPTAAKKREPLTAWANVYDKTAPGLHNVKENADAYALEGRLECVQLKEVIPGTVTLTKVEVLNVLNSTGIILSAYEVADILKQMGFEE